ncbi:PilZ domain-containing protein [Methylophaga lonarensis MPL]|uniref:PilZ domain-containing protein n=1 Tax=Methylophaga lonarensis MPL TaxID=1286106 RepID=M7PH53_9GAMM|nr:PilZ domain-containing protein [Methylophaga lonarensis]EMR13225.1 PilZ domain-containing protein [Methylophaga lonarensis MPL]
MNLNNLTGAERRAFFRINDTVIVDFSQESGTEQPAMPAGDQQQRAQLNTIQTALGHLIEKINHQDREIGRALRLMDEKLNLLTQRLEAKMAPADMSKAREVNLSAGGMSVIDSQEYPAKTSLRVNLQLLPSMVTIYLQAKVISCKTISEQKEEPAYLLRMAFTEMTEEDRNTLVRHTLSRQAEILRTQKSSV